MLHAEILLTIAIVILSLEKLYSIFTNLDIFCYKYAVLNTA